jgi:hypothetical protein
MATDTPILLAIDDEPAILDLYRSAFHGEAVELITESSVNAGN